MKMTNFTQLKNKMFDKSEELVISTFREPYTSISENGEIKIKKNSGGVVTALDSLLKKTGGVWYAFSRLTPNSENEGKSEKTPVNSDEGNYLLNRVLIDRNFDENYQNISNRGIWPLFHQVFIRPIFSDANWIEYKKANELMAKNIAELGDSNKLIWIHDYQLMLVSKYLQSFNNNSVTGFFWHIPWPSASTFRIFPYANEALEGLLANSVIGFQTQYDASNFMNSVDSVLEARIDRAQSEVYFQGKKTKVVSIPVSIDPTEIQIQSEKYKANLASLLKKIGIKNVKFGIGVDRLDYTKGLKEKMLGILDFFDKNPQFVGKFTFIQIASPTRVHLNEYKRTAEELEEVVEDINWKYATLNWKPIVLIDEFIDYSDILTLYSGADICIVSSLDDGMNLVCKEFVASTKNGVLILSKFAGASLELVNSISINPYSVSEISNSILLALNMPEEERIKRIVQMKSEINDHSVFDWAEKFLTVLKNEQKRQI